MTRWLAAVLALIHATTLLGAIRGSVFDGDGTPVAGAVVRAYRPEGSSARRTRIATRAERPVLTSATTGDDGTFVLDTKRAGMFEVLLTAKGYAPARQLVFADDAIVFGLTAATAQTVTVTADGKPLANAIVIARGANIELDLGTTNDKGTLSIPDPRGWCISLIVRHPDYAPAEQTVSLRTSYAFALASGTRVTGRAVDANGKPVANAILRIDEWPAGKSGDDGTFVLPHVAASAKRIDAFASSMIGSAPRAAAEMQIRLEPARVVSGTVTGDDRRAIAGMPVAAYATTGLAEARVFFSITDDRGAYRLEVPPSTYTVTPMGSDELEFTSVTAELRAKETVRADFAAKRAERLRGFVRDARNKPVAGAAVTYLGEGTPLIYATLTNDAPVVRTAADGSFSLPAFQNVAKMQLVALHPRYAAGIAELTDARPIITLPDGIVVTGTVVDAGDKPVAGAGVVVVQDPKSAIPFPLDILLSTGMARAFAETAEDGTFRIHLNALMHDVAVWKEGYSAGRKGNYRPGQPLRVVLARGVAISGKVNGVSGEGRVYARSADNAASAARIEADGSFVFSSLAPGGYTLMAQTPAGTSEEKTVDAPAAGVVIEMPQPAELRGTVVDKESGEPVVVYDYMLSGANGSVTDGKPFTEKLAAGAAIVMILAEGYANLSRSVTLTAGKTTEITFALVKGRTVRGRVVDDSGAPMADVRVSPETDELTFIAGSQTDDAGEFVLDALPREAITLAFTQDDFLTTKVDVAAGVTEPLTVTLSRGHSVTGRVIDETGNPVAGADVSASSAVHDASWRSEESAADGTFRLRGLAAGRYSFRAAKAGYRVVELKDIDIQKNPSIVLQFGQRSPTGAIHGRVNGYSEGGFLAGQVIGTPGDDDYEQMVRGEIERDGSFRIEEVPAGELILHAAAYGMNRQRSSGNVKATVIPGGDVQVTLEFRNDVVVSGMVTEDGMPAPARQVSFSSGLASWDATTDSAGHYEVTGIEPGHYTVSVYGVRGTRSYRTEYDAQGSGTFDIAMEFARIEGRVADSEGAPIEAATVEIERNASVTTDAAGSFSIEIPRGEYDVRATKRGFASAIQHVTAGAAPLSFRLVRSDGMRVRLVDARDGATLGGYVIARDSAGVQLNRVHDQERDGTLRISVVPGTYRISASADGYATQTVAATIPRETELVLGLTPGGTLIVRADREPAEIVKLIQPNGEEYVRCECNGIAEIRLTGRTTTIEHVAPGPYAMQVIGADAKVIATYPVTIGEGSVSTVDVDLP